MHIRTFSKPSVSQNAKEVKLTNEEEDMIRDCVNSYNEHEAKRNEEPLLSIHNKAHVIKAINKVAYDWNMIRDKSSVEKLIDKLNAGADLSGIKELSKQCSNTEKMFIINGSQNIMAETEKDAINLFKKMNPGEKLTSIEEVGIEENSKQCSKPECYVWYDKDNSEYVISKTGIGGPGAKTREHLFDGSEDECENYIANKTGTKQFSKFGVSDKVAERPTVNTDIFFNTAHFDANLKSMQNLFAKN